MAKSVDTGKDSSPPVDVTKWYDNQPDRLPREKWSSGKTWSAGADIKSTFVFDQNKCSVCGGKGTYFKPINRRRKRQVKCEVCDGL